MSLCSPPSVLWRPIVRVLCVHHMLVCTVQCYTPVIILIVIRLAPLRVHSIARSQQPPERAVLSHIDCISRLEFVGLKVI